MDMVIYGAQAIALGAYDAIHHLYPGRMICCFLVTERSTNPRELSGLPVRELHEFASGLSWEEKENTVVLIATPESVMSEIEQSLDAHGLYCHVRLSSQRWAELVGYHYACDGRFMPLSALPVGYHRASLHVFMAKFYKDKPLGDGIEMPEWVTPIQVGAALCTERIAGILDCDGENISEKNVNYSELTALYWMWRNRLVRPTKNEECDYYGLVHYRRILDLSEDDILRLADNDIDAVLPYPMPYEPNIEAHHERYLADRDWKAVLAAVRELQPEYAGIFPEILHGKYFYNYNIMLARRQVLEDYCSWLFPILERVEELSRPQGNERADRYIGYVGEMLATLYYMANRDKLNIVHTGCRFLI